MSDFHTFLCLGSLGSSCVFCGCVHPEIMNRWSSCDLRFPFFGSDAVGHLRWIMIDVRYCNFHSFACPRKALVCEC